MIIGILGFSGTGKDTVANLILDQGAQKIGFADAIKRTCISIFDFTYEQMWGTQEQKATPDLRYPREHSWDPSDNYQTCACCRCTRYDERHNAPQCYLTGRYALQIIGTEGGRQCYDNIWVEKAIEYAKLIQRGFLYNPAIGIEDSSAGFVGSLTRHKNPNHAVFIDCRFINEVKAIQDAGGRVFRVKRPGFEAPKFNHPSETEQLQIPDDKLQGVIMNDGTLEDLKLRVQELLKE